MYIAVLNVSVSVYLCCYVGGSNELEYVTVFYQGLLFQWHFAQIGKIQKTQHHLKLKNKIVF